MTTTNAIRINGYAFTLDGLKITYSEEGRYTTLFFDPLATCETFQQLGFIENFTADQNGEPVILFVEHNSPLGYGYDLWNSFVKTFPIHQELLQSIVEYRKECKERSRFNYLLNGLLHPELKKTA